MISLASEAKNLVGYINFYSTRENIFFERNIKYSYVIDFDNKSKMIKAVYHSQFGAKPYVDISRFSCLDANQGGKLVAEFFTIRLEMQFSKLLYKKLWDI